MITGAPLTQARTPAPEEATRAERQARTRELEAGARRAMEALEQGAAPDTGVSAARQAE